MGDIEIVVNDRDEPIGAKHWRDKTYDDIYEAAALWLTDEMSGDILLAQRSWNKFNDPGKWGCAAAGTIEVDETYDSNIVKEIEEEIGLTNLTLHKGPKQFVDDGKFRYFCQWYTSTVDKNKVAIKIQEEEVEAAEWVPKQQFLDDLKNHPDKYVPDMQELVKLLGIA